MNRRQFFRFVSAAPIAAPAIVASLSVERHVPKRPPWPPWIGEGYHPRDSVNLNVPFARVPRVSEEVMRAAIARHGQQIRRDIVERDPDAARRHEQVVGRLKPWGVNQNARSASTD